MPIASVPQLETLWAVDYPDGEDRELTLLQIARELAAGVISPSSLVWREGMTEWLELSQVPDLLSLVPAAKPAAPPPEPTPPPAMRPQAPSAPQISTPNLPNVGAKPRLPAPSAPGIDHGPGGSRGSSPLTPAPAPRPRQPTISGIGDFPPPTPPSPTSTVRSLPTGNAPPFPLSNAPPFPLSNPPPFPTSKAPTFSMGGSQPFPTGAAPALPAQSVMVPAPARAAPFATAPQPFGRSNQQTVAGAAPLSGIPDWPQKKSRAPLFIGGALLIALAVGIFYLVSSSSDKAPAPAPISALPAGVPSTPRPVAAREAPAGAVDAADPTAEHPRSRSALEPPSTAPSTTPNAGFAELFANGARHADGKKIDGGPTQHFDQEAAKAALATAAFETAKCLEKGGPTGRATVVVTFEPSGKVASATVSDPPFAGTSSGACIAEAMKRATVPAFSGLPGTLTKVISIQ